MSPLWRGGLAFFLFASFYLWIAPFLLGEIDALRVAHSAPLQSRVVRQKLSRLPEEEQQKIPAQQLAVALTNDAELERAEETWTRGVGAILTVSQQKQGMEAIVVDNSPPHPPPPECPGVEGDIAALASLLIQNYGYQGITPTKIPDRDPWVGPDRRSRGRALLALAEAHALTPEQAAALLSLSLDLLEVQRERAENREMMEKLLPVVMGESKGYVGGGGER